jgi:hypothetical protein
VSEWTGGQRSGRFDKIQNQTDQVSVIGILQEQPVALGVKK